MKVLHVIERLTRGGAGRALVAMGKYVGRRLACEQTVLSLRPSDEGARLLAQEARLELVDAAPAEVERELLDAADIVHIHFWNTPELYAWMRRDLRPARVVLTQHVAGEYPAQRMTRAVRDYADQIVLDSPYSLRLPVFADMTPALRQQRVSAVLAGPDFARLAGGEPRPHEGFRVGYVGTLSFEKLHPRFVAMSAAAPLTNARFVVCGGEPRILARQAERLGVEQRFDFRGYTEDVGSVFSELDVFGYPLCRDTYAAAELVLQEAMFCGVPPVLMRDCAPSLLVADGETGLLADDEADYGARLEQLQRDAHRRARLAAGARDWARSHAGAENAAPALAAVYESAMSAPRRARAWIEPAPLSPHAGANAFLEALGDAAGIFAVSLTAADGAERRAADAAIGAVSPVVSGAACGGVLHYRLFYPEDPYLCFWSALVLLGQGRPALAAAELERARRRGMEEARVRSPLQEALARAR